MAKQEVSLIDRVRNRLNENAGKELTRSFGEDENLMQVKSWIPLKPFFKLGTGGDGFPAGHITMVVGETDTGKTTIVMEGMVSCQKLGGIVYLIDSEHKFSLSRFALMGGNPLDLVILQSESLEEAWKNVDFVLKETQTLRDEGINVPMMMVWDSIAASTPQKILEAEAGDAHVSIQAKINNNEVRKLRQSIKRSEIAVVIINHFYMTMPKNSYEQSKLIIKGGSELGLMSTLILLTKQGAKITRTIKGEEQQIGRKTKFTVFKGHFHGRTIVKEVSVVDIGILENDEELDKYKKSLKGDF